MVDITAIVEAAFALIAAIITVFVAPYIKARTTAQERSEIAAWVSIAVKAAEQIFNGPGRGAEKKNYVLDWLSERGIKVDEKRLDALIEAAVYGLKSGGEENAN